MAAELLVKKLSEKGMVVPPNFRNVDALKEMLKLLEKDDENNREIPKKKVAITQKKQVKRPDNVQVVEPGTYIVSFNLTLDIKNRGYTTKLVTDQKYVVDKEEPAKVICQRIAEKYIKDNYHDSEVEIIDITKIRFTPYKEANLREIKVKQLGLQYKEFPADTIINKNIGECALDTIMAAVTWPMYNRRRLIDELAEIAGNEDFVRDGITTNLIMAWARMKQRVTCLAMQPFHHVFESVIAQGRTDFTLAFEVNNNHIFPIVDHSQKMEIAKTKKLDFSEMRYVANENESWKYLTEEEAMGEMKYVEKVLHVETDDLTHVLQQCIAKTGFMPVGIVSTGPFVQCFKHPVTEQMIVASPDFLLRMEAAKQLMKETNYIGFCWANQSWAELSNAWTEFSVGHIPKSEYGRDLLMIREKYPQSGYIGMTREVIEEEEADIVSFDIRYCYTDLVENNEYPFPVYSVFDEIEPWKPVDEFEMTPEAGEAYVARSFHLGSAKYPRGFYSTFFVEYAIAEEAIISSDVTHVIKASKCLPANTFQTSTKKLREHLGNNVANTDTVGVMAKKMVNAGIGAWGRRYAKSGVMAVTDSFEIALGMVTEDKDVRLSEVGSYWFMRKEAKRLLHSGHTALRKHIICLGHIKLHQMEKKVCGPDSEVIAYNTDSVKVLNPRRSFHPVDKADAKPGDICLEGKLNLRGRIIGTMPDGPEYKHTKLAWKDLNKVETEIQRPAAMVVGQPGFGKSYLLNQLQEGDEKDEMKVEKMTWTKTAALNIRGETLDHVFPKSSTRQEWIQKGIKYDVLQFDEFMIIPERWFSVFLEMKLRKPELRFRFFGDPTQLHSQNYDDKSALWYDYSKSALMHFLVDGNRLELSYLEKTARYDADMKKKLDSFSEKKTLKAFGEVELFTPDECDFSIVKSSQKRDEINEKWADHYLEKFPKTKTVKCGKLKLWKGMYLIAHGNDGAIINAIRYRVKSINTSKCGTAALNEVTLEVDGHEWTATFKQIANNCQYGYADTVMRTISRSIKGRFNIYEVKQMSWNELFVALSRASTASNIGMWFADWKFEMSTPPEKGRLIKLKPELFTGEIYLRTDGEKSYIGLTTQGMKKREKQHKAAPVSEKVAEWERSKGDKIVTTVIESYLCSTENQLAHREDIAIAQLTRDECMNTQKVRANAVEKTATAIEEITVEYDRFKIVDEEKKRGFRIQWRDMKGVKQDKKFSYIKKDKADQRKAAEEFRAGLVKEYFI